MKHVLIKTLGCKLNFAETSAIGHILADSGFLPLTEGETPDLIVVNTCSVTQVADKKGRQLIRNLAKRYPDAKLVVTGCFAQLKPDEVAAIPGVDAVIGNNEKLKIRDYLEDVFGGLHPVDTTDFRSICAFTHACERGDRTRYFLKVQDGCDYFCTYCTIPFARGRSRSPQVSELVAQAEKVAAEGGREIVLTGVNIGDFGKGSSETLFDLVRALDAVAGIERYRISSIEPNLITPEIIRWVATEARAFMPHFHIPLQSGSDHVLKLMNRRYDTALFAERVAMVRDLIPDAFIGVDIIAGARGETPEEWARTLEFVESLDITRLHVFPYSERPGTAALKLGQAVDQAEKHRRVEQLTAISRRKHEAFLQRAIGTCRPVLWEQPHGATLTEMRGHTDNYLLVRAPYDPALVNTIPTVTLTRENLISEHE